MAVTRLSLTACAALAALTAAAPALAQAPTMPAPGPEVQKLGYFVGTWRMEGTVKDTPIMPGGKMASTDVCEWFEGRYAVVCRSQGKGPMGPAKGIGIMSWSGEEKVYLYYGIDNSPMAMATVPRGSVEGGVWTYTDESRMNGKPVKSRYTMVVGDARSYAFKWEVEGEGGQWMTVVEGKATKAK